MPDTGLTRSPKFQKGALVQIVKGLTGVVPNVIPFQGLSAGNWGRWNEAQREIYLHEDVFTQSRLSAPTELGYEVGMAELHRLFGVSRDTVPVVTNPPPGLNYLTHVIDSLL